MHNVVSFSMQLFNSVNSSYSEAGMTLLLVGNTWLLSNSLKQSPWGQISSVVVCMLKSFEIQVSHFTPESSSPLQLYTSVWSAWRGDWSFLVRPQWSLQLMSPFISSWLSYYRLPEEKLDSCFPDALHSSGDTHTHTSHKRRSRGWFLKQRLSSLPIKMGGQGKAYSYTIKQHFLLGV